MKLVILFLFLIIAILVDYWGYTVKAIVNLTQVKRENSFFLDIT